MSKFKIIAFPIALVVWIGMNLLFINYSREVYQELQERHLDIIVNYAVDAATDEMIVNTADLGVDYVDYERMSFEPTVALDMFCTIFLKNFNMSTSRDNQILVKSVYLPVFAVAVYDGYYIAQPTKINAGGARDSVFSFKYPYLYREGADLYALNLGFLDSKLYNRSSLQKVDAPISKEEQKAIISTNISDALMETVYKQTDGQMFSTIYVPAEMTTITRTNPIDRITVLAYVNQVEIGFGSTVDAFGIGGTRVAHEEFVGGYIRDGIKYYAYIKQIPKHISVIESFENPMLAAKAGYYFDPVYLK